MKQHATNDDQMPTVAIIGSRGYPSFYGGFETAVRRIAPHLADRGWHVRVYGRPGSHLKVDQGRDPRVEVVTTWGVDSKSLSTLSYGLFSVLHALVHKPQVALVMNVANGFWIPLLRLRGVPTVVNVDGIEWERDKWSKLGKFIFKTGARLTARFANELVFDAIAIGEYWKTHFGRSGVFIPYGGEAVGVSDREAEFSPGTYVLLVARFVPENSVGLFLEAAPKIVASADVDVVLVGSAPDGDPLQQEAERISAAHPRIHLLGHISDDARLFDLWKRAGAYFHGHTVGGTNPALVQAMALGARVVARDTVYNREVLGNAGTFCDGNAESIAKVVTATLADGRDLGAIAKERAALEYNWDLVCDRYEETARRHLP